jgi:hypothetical protein
MRLLAVIFAPLPLVGRYGLDCSREACMDRRVDRPVLDFGACRVLTEEIVAFPVFRRPDGSGNKSTTTIRADVLQDASDTSGAECALVGADARLKRGGRQRLVAVLAGRSEFEHAAPLPVTANVVLCGRPIRMPREAKRWRPVRTSYEFYGKPLTLTILHTLQRLR